MADMFGILIVSIKDIFLGVIKNIKKKINVLLHQLVKKR